MAIKVKKRKNIKSSHKMQKNYDTSNNKNRKNNNKNVFELKNLY